MLESLAIHSRARDQKLGVPDTPHARSTAAWTVYRYIAITSTVGTAGARTIPPRRNRGIVYAQARRACRASLD